MISRFKKLFFSEKKYFFLFISLIILIIGLIIGLIFSIFNIILYLSGFIAFIFLIFFIRKKIDFSQSTLFWILILSFFMTINFFISTPGKNIYDIWIIKDLIRYDNLMHFLGGGVVALFMFDIVKSFFKKSLFNKSLLQKIFKKTKIHETIIFFGIIILASLGIGALFEIIELIDFVFLGNNVESYLNNAVDLVYDLLGSIIFMIFRIIKR